MWAAVLLALPLLLGAAEPVAKIAIVAYINQTSGCQTDTEECLRQLAVKHPGRVTVEFVDIGGKGRERWQRDGLHCMGIRLNGSSEAVIETGGVRIPVRFEMPAGYQWTLDDLGIAVRQMLTGVSDEDRRPPPVSTRQQAGKGALLVGNAVVLELPEAERIAAAARALTEASATPLTQNDFTAKVDAPDKTRLMARDQAFVEITKADAERQHCTIRDLAANWLSAVADAYPQPVRPFPGMDMPERR